jgi:hypothetical protein
MRPATNYENLVKKHTGMAYHINAGRGIDYETRMRYVNSDGVRFWEHGAFDVLTGGHRNPDGRKKMAEMLGTYCVKASEYPGKMFTPEGLEVRKSQLVDNPVLWIDQEHSMMVNASHYEPLKYACQSSPPIPSRQIKVGFPDKKADEDKWPEIKKWLDWVRAQKLLGGECPVEARQAWNRDRRANNTIMKTWVESGAGPTGAAIWLLWCSPESWEPLARKYFLQQNQIIRDYPWLKTTKPA